MRFPSPAFGLFASILIACFFAPSSSAAQTQSDEDRWWPIQAVPASILRTTREFPQPRLALDMMAQSIAGLAAKAVNESRGDELVWVDNGNVDLEDWLARWLARHPNVRTTATLGPWELVDHFAKKGIIRGYILYRLDTSPGELNSHRPGMDNSVNVATSLAGLLNAIIVDESLENTAQAHGLKLLRDARGKTQAWTYQTFRDQFNKRMLCCQDPRKPHTRDLAIAQKALTLYGADEPTPFVMAWLEPLSPILGWNGGDEFKTTDLSSRYGHIQTATDWCMNLPLLMAGSESNQPAPAPAKPASSPPAGPGPDIDRNDQRSAVSFIQTDGDNVQWQHGNFFRNPSYWGNSQRGRIPFGWSVCFAQLAQLCPQAIDYAVATRAANDSFIEWGGGYYYPDHFAMDRSDRWDLLARHARRTWSLMKKTNTRIIGFNVTRYDSADARKACEIFAAQTDGLLGILIFQYSPYEAGAGQTFWVKDSHGLDLPVITARYSIWENANDRPRAGTPARIAREIRETVSKLPPGSGPRYDWAITHAWSWFQKAPGTDENAENLPTDKLSGSQSGSARERERGFTPVTWCAERLPADIRVISPEELLWRIREQHDPVQTKRFIEQLAN